MLGNLGHLVFHYGQELVVIRPFGLSRVVSSFSGSSIRSDPGARTDGKGVQKTLALAITCRIVRSVRIPMSSAHFRVPIVSTCPY